MEARLQRYPQGAQNRRQWHVSVENKRCEPRGQLLQVQFITGTLREMVERMPGTFLGFTPGLSFSNSSILIPRFDKTSSSFSPLRMGYVRYLPWPIPSRINRSLSDNFPTGTTIVWPSPTLFGSISWLSLIRRLSCMSAQGVCQVNTIMEYTTKALYNPTMVVMMAQKC